MSTNEVTKEFCQKVHDDQDRLCIEKHKFIDQAISSVNVKLNLLVLGIAIDIIARFVVGN